jgi:hypothetical protein
MESAVASKPGLSPPNQALNMTAQRNSDAHLSFWPFLIISETREKPPG